MEHPEYRENHIAVWNLYQNKLCDSMSTKNQAFIFRKYYLITMWFYVTMCNYVIGFSFKDYDIILPHLLITGFFSLLIRIMPSFGMASNWIYLPDSFLIIRTGSLTSPCITPAPFHPLGNGRRMVSG